jgi:spermidine synthase
LYIFLWGYNAGVESINLGEEFTIEFSFYNDARFNVIEGDGIAYLAANPNNADCLMIDAFDRFGIPPKFCSQDFFDSCEMALSNSGIFSINLWGSDQNFDIYLQRIEQSFNNQTLILPTGKPGNILVFGFKHDSKLNGLKLNPKKLKERAKILENTHKIEFLSFVEKLCEHNQIN